MSADVCLLYSLYKETGTAGNNQLSVISEEGV
ncbi:MAG: hypothetical protein CLLPBCKN_008113 [Chroococcidiopsis cubana SAG 39.79]|nr:hypothetical protein [Chroococcidiopsis cubana SAG 39.79]